MIVSDKIAPTYSFLSGELAPLSDIGKEVRFAKNDIITGQFSASDYFYLLIEGSVEFFINIEEGDQELFVGESHDALTPVGWSGFRSPNRYATTVKAAVDNTFTLRWKHKDLSELFDREPKIGVAFLELIIPQARNLLQEIVLLINKFNPNLIEEDMIGNQKVFTETQEIPTNNDVKNLLRKSPFFEVFNEDTLEKIIPLAKRIKLQPGEVLLKQGEISEGLFFLESGKILFTYKNIEDPASSAVTAFRSISIPGYIVSWSGALNKSNIVTATATYESVILHIDQDDLNELLENDVSVHLTFLYRLLWLIGNQLRAFRARLISAKFDKEIIAIKNLFEQNSTQLSILSALHKVPYLLDNKITLGDGLKILENVKSTGNTLEKSLATLSLDILGQIKKEHHFFQGLSSIYNFVVSDHDFAPSDLRNESSKKFINVFSKVPQLVVGKELLPKEPGHIFIYNHLRNDPYNTLPNNFQLTLDSHFISSVILYQQYNDPGIRVVRISRGPEYGHQDYYNKLGHINVLTAESDETLNTPEEKEKRRKQFYEEAGNYLNDGTNLIISPEGTSYSTEESPGSFKPGAFRLAASLEKEPFIVPIVVANFDKRIRYNTLAVMIKKPFKVSEFVSDPTDRSQMKSFLADLEKKYKGYVGEITELASKATHNQNRLE